MLIGVLSPIAGVLVYFYAPEMFGLLSIFVAGGMALITAMGACRKLLLDVLDRIDTGNRG
jgi:hypothetical protein